MADEDEVVVKPTAKPYIMTESSDPDIARAEAKAGHSADGMTDMPASVASQIQRLQAVAQELAKKGIIVDIGALQNLAQSQKVTANDLAIVDSIERDVAAGEGKALQEDMGTLLLTLTPLGVVSYTSEEGIMLFQEAQSRQATQTQVVDTASLGSEQANSPAMKGLMARISKMAESLPNVVDTMEEKGAGISRVLASTSLGSLASNIPNLVTFSSMVEGLDASQGRGNLQSAPLPQATLVYAKTPEGQGLGRV